ncbi:unnamed protein product [Tetraodon nigroviridis]|uniref:Chromosome 2 SCAF14976, whole genome shotgun sequence n=1 Tax=Tetraodon nigroviridis TaxID=99883 RepID=Q4RYH4_TETNG|nr:unnamed protein product [Tetraodon nigroviridis]
MTLVLVQFDFDYRAKDGRLVSIKPNESYILVSKTNEHWWHVRRDQSSRPFYVPAQYVKEVPPERGPKITVNVPSPQGASEGGCRLSTHGFGWDAPETDRPEQTTSSAARLVDEEDGSSSFSSQQNGSLELYAKPVPGYRKQSEGSLHDEDMEFPPPPDLPELDLEPEANLPECDEMMELPESGPNPPPRCRAAAEGSSTELFSDQVEDDASQSAVYVNVAQLRKSISKTPPSCSPSYLDLNGWEVHVDQDSGQEYYYHPDTGQTTWDKPFLDSPTYPESLTAENPLSPSPPLSPAFSPSTASPSSARTSDWEQLVDETSGRPYFYNPMSGETTWEPPEQLSPYPSAMEPMSVHRFHEDGPPPLPEEDYPQDEDPDAEDLEELLATGPPRLPKEYMLGHASRPTIPRATLDRSTPAGWTLNVDPSGAWVFTSEHSPEQWIKSVDDRGFTYYYLRDGSRSLWNLPERFFLTHRRNTSDYSSDSSSTGNSPETQHNAFGYRSGRKPYYLTSRWLRYNVGG